MIVRRIRPDEGPLLRHTRLEALADAPTAFAMTHAEESDYPPEHWTRAAAERSTGTDDATFFAEDDGDVVGLVGCYRSDDGPFHLVSMWVAPRGRGRGAATALTREVVELARQAGAPGVSLWVEASNEPAIRLYESVGFTFDGTARPLPSHPEQTERRMTLDL
ncbi:MAG: GNAT family N-acetyltransferase [Acidimicrobiia bacterium]|nr:GNAT family N-acetyltransferase [Acidimicrobiia bacterium]